MNILWIATKAPWPPVDGGRLLLWHTLAALRDRGHRVALVAPVAPGELERRDEIIGALSTVCEPHLVPRPPRSLLRAWLAGRGSGRPVTVERHLASEVAAAAGRVLRSRTFDVVHAEQVQAFPQARAASGGSLPVVLRAQNVESDLWAGVAARAPFGRGLLRAEARRLARAEGEMMAAADAVVALSREDAARLTEIGGPAVAPRVVLPPFPPRLETSAPPLPGSPAYVLVGSAGWAPNADSVRWFLADVWPALVRAQPAARLHVFGAPRARGAGVVGHPPPADSGAAFAPGSVLVVPLRVASGIRMKILEAWARDVPVIATPTASRGLPPGASEAVVLAEDAGSFLAAARRLSDQSEATALRAAGRRLLAARCDPTRIAAELEEVYAEAIERHRCRGAGAAAPAPPAPAAPREEESTAAEPAPAGPVGRWLADRLAPWWRWSPRGPRELTATLTVLSGSGVALVGSLVTRVLMARALDPASLGLLLLAIALASPLAGMLSLGLGQAAALVVAERRARGDREGAQQVARAALTLGALAGVAGSLALWLGADLLARAFAAAPDRAPLADLMRSVTPIVLSVPLGTAMLGVHRGFGGATARAVLRDGGGGVARAGAVGLVALAGGGAWALGLAFALGAALSDAIYVAYGLARGWAGRVPAALDRGLLARLRGLTPLHLITELRRWIDVLTVGLLVDPVQMGMYALARGFVRVLEAIRDAPVHTFLPTAATLDAAALRPVHQRVRLLGLALLWAPVTVCVAAPEWVMVPLAGAEYAAAAPLLAWLAAASTAEVAGGYNQEVLLARGGERTALVVNLATSAATVGLLLAVAPRWGAVGAAAGLLAARAGRVAALAVVVRSLGYRPPRTPGPARAALAALGGLTALRWSGAVAGGPLAALTALLALGGAAILGRSVLRERTRR
ncbi:MAG TPA: glycosyltransferase [Thermoanaerobaculia bacterium]|nr:glycosyltransferase [Thermoanaerobaculia bacterium]